MSAICPANIKILDSPNNNIYGVNIITAITNVLMHSQTNGNRSCKCNTLNATAPVILLALQCNLIAKLPLASDTKHEAEQNSKQTNARYNKRVSYALHVNSPSAVLLKVLFIIGENDIQNWSSSNRVSATIVMTVLY
jgi:hypothetical protein